MTHQHLDPAVPAATHISDFPVTSINQSSDSFLTWLRMCFCLVGLLLHNSLKECYTSWCVEASTRLTSSRQTPPITAVHTVPLASDLLPLFLYGPRPGHMHRPTCCAVSYGGSTKTCWGHWPRPRGYLLGSWRHCYTGAEGGCPLTPCPAVPAWWAECRTFVTVGAVTRRRPRPIIATATGSSQVSNMPLWGTTSTEGHSRGAVCRPRARDAAVRERTLLSSFSPPRPPGAEGRRALPVRVRDATFPQMHKPVAWVQQVQNAQCARPSTAATVRLLGLPML